MKNKDKKLEEAMESLKKSLLKDKAEYAKIGFDLGKHWKDMLATLPESKEKVKTKEENPNQ